jgi:recombination protein RecT
MNEALKGRVAETSIAPAKRTDVLGTINTYLKKMAPELARALPKHLTADRLGRLAFTTIRNNPQLQECRIESLCGAVMMAAQLGMEPTALGECYLVPYGRECQFILGYRGMISLARRSGQIKSINAHPVYENDQFTLSYGLYEECKHTPWHCREDKRFEEPGAFKGAYLVAHLKDGGTYVHYMPKAEIDAHRKRSKAANAGPWVTDYEAMACKTVVRSAFKWLPVSVEQALAVEKADEQAPADVKEAAENLQDVPYRVVEGDVADIELEGEGEGSLWTANAKGAPASSTGV